MRLLLSGLFSLCFNNDLVREEFINLLGSKDNKKYVKFIRDWMKEADKFYNHVKMDKMGVLETSGSKLIRHSGKNGLRYQSHPVEIFIPIQ
jgi:hypothetical protein